MNPINEIDFSKDSTVAIIKNLQRKAKIKLIIPDSIDYDSNNVFGSLCDLEIISLKKKKYVQKNSKRMNLNKLDCVFFRKDPPVDEDYINALHLLDLAEKQGAKIFNTPNSIKNFNEKIFALHFSQYIPQTLVTSKIEKIKMFFESHKTIIVKPLDGMGGISIYKFNELSEENLNIIQEMTNSEKTQIICQEFIEDIYDGDHRVLIIHGKPFEKTLAPYKLKFLS